MDKLKKRNLTPILIALPSLSLGIAWNMKSTVLPLLVNTITKSSFKLGLIMTVGPMAGMIFNYLGGVISDRANLRLGKRKPWVLLGGSLGCLFLLIIGFTPDYVLLFMVAFAAYSSLNFFQGAYYSWIPEAVEPNQIGRVNGLGKLFYSLGGMLLFFLGVTLFNIGKELPFVLILVFVLIPMIITTTYVKEKPVTEHKPPKLSLDFLKNLAAMRVFMTAFFFYIVNGLITPFWITYYKKVDHFTSNEISFALIGFTCVGLVLSLFVGACCDKWSKQYILALACIIYIIAFFIGWNVNGLPMLWCFALVSGVAFVIMQVVYYALIPEVAPKEKLGEYMGINNVFLCVPQIISSILGGYLLSSNEGFLLLPISIIALFIGLVIIGFGKLNHKVI